MTKTAYDETIQWLLEPDEPSIRYLALTELLDFPLDSIEAKSARMAIAKSPRVMSIFAGQEKDGGFGAHPYDKWMGAHWRLVSLVDLAIPEGDKRAIKAANQVLAWLTSPEHKKNIRLINGRIRRCASQEGNALRVCGHLGMADDPRAKYLAESLIEWQWPDGGWNCDKEEKAHHSSFHESVIPMMGLLEYHRVTGDKESLATAKRTGEFLLRHHLFRSEKTGEVINPTWLDIRYPHYWHYNILQGLRAIAMLGKLTDPRPAEALDILEKKRLPDGKWKADGYYWKPATTKGPYREPANWWRGQPNKMITFLALSILKKAGRGIFM